MSIALQKQEKIKSYRFISILDKMIMQDLMKTVIAVLSVIVIIIVSRKFIKVLAKAIEGNISNETVLSILGLNTIIAINTFLPASVFIAILMVLGRMYRDQEMAAVASAGGGVAVIYRAVFLFVFPLIIVASSLSMIATPWAESKIQLLTHEDQKVADLRGIAAGRFSEYNHGELIFYTEEVDKNKRMHKVFVQKREKDKLSIINAKYGQIKNLPGGLYLVLEVGERVLGIPGERDFIIENFTEYAIRLEKKTTILNQPLKGLPTHEIWLSSNLLSVVEMQKRLSIPLAVFFLSFLAVPLAKLSPRGGIYGNLFVAFGIYFVYGNLKRVSHSWVVNETIPMSFGYFWVYLLLLLLGCMLLIRFYGSEWIAIKISQWRGA